MTQAETMLKPHRILNGFDMPLGFVLSESGTKMSHLYFTTSAIVSLLYNLETGSSAEIPL